MEEVGYGGGVGDRPVAPTPLYPPQLIGKGGGGGRGPEGTVEQALPQDSIIASVSPVCGDVSATQIVPRRLVLEIKMIKSNIQYKKISKQSNTTMYVKRKKHSF